MVFIIAKKDTHIEIEAWFVSSVDKARYPSGKFGRQMSKGIPFKVTKKEEIAFFNKIAKNKSFLSKVDKSKALHSSVEDDIKSKEYINNRQFADEKIDDLQKKVDALELQVKQKDSILMIKQTELDAALLYKEKYEKMEAKVAKLDESLKKAKAKAKANKQ